MKIYHLETKAVPDWEQYDGFVVIAPDGRRARRMADQHVRDDQKGDFLRPEKVSCREIGKARLDARTRIVLASNMGA